MNNCYSLKFNNWQLYALKEVDSTMDEIKKDCYKSNLNTLLMAYTQTNGRGRKNRKWISKLGNLFLSIKLNTFHIPDAFLLNYLIGIIIYDTINSFLAEKKNIFIKWPNDLLIDGKKIAGILIDTCSKGSKISDLYIGIGINIKVSPTDLDYTTTCLKSESSLSLSRKKILNKLIYYFNYWEHIFKVKSVSYILKAWMNRSFPVNSKISIKTKEGIIKGIYKGINLNGSIKILINNKENNYFNIDTIVQ